LLIEVDAVVVSKEQHNSLRQPAKRSPVSWRCLQSTGFLAVASYVLLMLALDAYLFKIPSLYSRKAALLNAAAPNATIIVLGSSHALFGVRPDKLQYPAVNLANVSQSLRLDEQIFQQVLRHNHNLRLLILPVSYFSLENTLKSDPEEWRDCMYFRYLKCSERNFWEISTDLRYWNLAFYYGPTRLRRLLGGDTTAANNCANWIHLDPFGWAPAPLKDCPEKTMESGLSRVKLHHTHMFYSLIQSNQAIVHRIISNCLSRGIKVVILTTPLHITYRNFTNAQRVNAMKQFLYSMYVPGRIQYADYMADHRFVDSDFMDSDHLSQKGATKLTLLLDKEFVQPLLE
jgi:hypothetical protein